MSPELRALVDAVKPPPLLLTSEQAAGYLGYSTAKWAELKAAGKLPKPRRDPLNGLPKYHRKDLDAWADALPAEASNLPRSQ